MEHKHPVAEANETSPFGSLSSELFYTRHSVSHASEYITSKQGLKLFTQWWTPNQTPIKGIVCVVHGYTGDSSWFVQLTSVHIAKHGFAVCAIDHLGHGHSEGLIAHLPDINLVVDECILFFNKFRARHAPNLPAFMYAESLGGAIALLITLRRDGDVPVRPFDGVVLNGAMCGISDKFKPPWPLEHFLSIAAALVPTWCVVPTRGSIPLVSFKVEWKRKLALASPRRPLRRPRAATAQELLRVCREVQGKFNEVDVPFLIVHGGDDVVCDPACVAELYERAASKDKTLRIYPGMWHQLVGEPDEDVELVFGEVVKWLVTRTDQAAVGSVVKSRDADAT
ncbi:caffeoylshikimate esterase-like [Olea europaea subsp. europaea]|uniref:Caffeoylshikimate esterase-like n=1 Tax=Olea europaea subsp. europaea TaxID=158383 RepID=A0A8S0UZC5_OLEEU|nr:caffeoylshikimate esterase-like [Olea europaea subsp. europaea]